MQLILVAFLRGIFLQLGCGGEKMTRKEKLIQRLKSKPKDFTWNELTSLLTALGFTEVKTGKTGGSRRRFVNSDNVIISLHKPHPGNILKRYQIEQIIEILSGEELI
jgi:predicted RNA binding protein YcfA (HicA-like mRNA interferase family)